MAYWSHKYDNKSIMQGVCPLCQNTSNQKIVQETDFFTGMLMINIWIPGDFIATCDVCHNSYKIKKERKQQLRNYFDNSNIKYKTWKSCLIKSFVLSPVLWIFAMFILAGILIILAEIWETITSII
jgi:hypothetical protein